MKVPIMMYKKVVLRKDSLTAEGILCEYLCSKAFLFYSPFSGVKTSVFYKTLHPVEWRGLLYRVKG